MERAQEKEEEEKGGEGAPITMPKSASLQENEGEREGGGGWEQTRECGKYLIMPITIAKIRIHSKDGISARIHIGENIASIKKV